jgi:hypothetical protein
MEGVGGALVDDVTHGRALAGIVGTEQSESIPEQC